MKNKLTALRWNFDILADMLGAQVSQLEYWEKENCWPVEVTTFVDDLYNLYIRSKPVSLPNRIAVYNLVSGNVVSVTDGQTHHIGANALARLYGVRISHCLINGCNLAVKPPGGYTYIINLYPQVRPELYVPPELPPKTTVWGHSPYRKEKSGKRRVDYDPGEYP